MGGEESRHNVRSGCSAKPVESRPPGLRDRRRVRPGVEAGSSRLDAPLSEHEQRLERGWKWPNFIGQPAAFLQWQLTQIDWGTSTLSEQASIYNVAPTLRTNCTAFSSSRAQRACSERIQTRARSPHDPNPLHRESLRRNPSLPSQKLTLRECLPSRDRSRGPSIPVRHLS